MWTKAAIGFRFDHGGRSSKDLQTMSVVAERLREETLDDSPGNSVRRGGFAVELNPGVL
jgi:hypothetical protein